MRPTSIINFERFYLGAMALGLVNSAMTWSQTQELMNSPEVAAAGLGSGFLFTTMAIGLIIPLLLWYFIARRGSNIAKWILVVLFGIGLLGFLASLANPLMPGGLSMVLGIAGIAIQGYAVYMLFRPDAVAWLTGAGPVDPDAFN
jgi:hypothetical protein